MTFGQYKGKWVVLIGFQGEDLPEIEPIVKDLKERFPDQGYNIMNSKFPAYTFVLCCFADSRDEAHRIGLALVKRELPQHLNLLYWVKEAPLLKYNASPR